MGTREDPNIQIELIKQNLDFVEISHFFVCLYFFSATLGVRFSSFRCFSIENSFLFFSFLMKPLKFFLRLSLALFLFLFLFRIVFSSSLSCAVCCFSILFRGHHPMLLFKSIAHDEPVSVYKYRF